MSKIFDERQLSIRGKVYKRMVIIFIIFMMIECAYTILSGNTERIFGYMTNPVLIFISIFVGSFEMIIKYAYMPETKATKRRMLLLFVIGIAGLFCNLMSLYQNHTNISIKYGQILILLCILGIPIVYTIAQYFSKKQEYAE